MIISSIIRGFYTESRSWDLQAPYLVPWFDNRRFLPSWWGSSSNLMNGFELSWQPWFAVLASCELDLWLVSSILRRNSYYFGRDFGRWPLLTQSCLWLWEGPITGLLLRLFKICFLSAGLSLLIVGLMLWYYHLGAFLNTRLESSLYCHRW